CAVGNGPSRRHDGLRGGGRGGTLTGTRVRILGRQRLALHANAGVLRPGAVRILCQVVLISGCGVRSRRLLPGGFLGELRDALARDVRQLTVGVARNEALVGLRGTGLLRRPPVLLGAAAAAGKQSQDGGGRNRTCRTVRE